MTVYPTKGGKIMSLKYKDQEAISQLTMQEAFGSTFWTSPQKEWNWPPVPEFDKQPYTVEEKDGHLVMTSAVNGRLGYRIRKDFSTDAKDGAIVITYSIINESDQERQVAPWEITRVFNDGGLIFFDAPLDGITPAGLMDFKAEYGAVWYKTDETNENRKINADGKGWLAYLRQSRQGPYRTGEPGRLHHPEAPGATRLDRPLVSVTIRRGDCALQTTVEDSTTNHKN